MYGIVDPMPFGQYKGTLVGTIIEDDPSYVQWLLSNTEFRLDAEALKYLEEVSK